MTEAWEKERIEKIQKIEIGDEVRSYDFDGRDDCYVEGLVLDVGVEVEGCPRYKIEVSKRVFGGKVLPREQTEDIVFPPVNGTPSVFGGNTNFVKLIRNPVTIEARKPKDKRYIIFWERIANSGVIGPVDALSPEDAIEKFGYNPEFVKHTVIQVPKRARRTVIGEAR